MGKIFGDFSRLRKNSDFDLVLKGRGFSRAVSATKSIAALAAEVTLCVREEVFPQPARSRGFCETWERA